MNEQQDRTQAYLNSLQTRYVTRSYSVTQSGSPTGTVLLPFNGKRVLVLISSGVGFGQAVGIKTDDGLLIPFPSVNNNQGIICTLHSHFTLPTMEWWVLGNGFTPILVMEVVKL